MRRTTDTRVAPWAGHAGLRRAGLPLAALLLSSSSLSVVGAAAAPTPPQSPVVAPGLTAATSAAAVKTKPTKWATLRTAYGKKALRTVAGKRYTLNFSGRKGDRVRIAAVASARQGDEFYPIDKRTLLGPRGSGLAAQPDGYTTLKRSGSHRIRFTATSSRTQLLKLAVRRTISQSVKVPARTGYQYAVDVKTGVGSRISTTGGMTGVRTGGRYAHHYGDTHWFDASTMIAVRGQTLLGVDGYADWEFTSDRVVVGDTVRVYATPHRAVRVTPRPMAGLSAAVSGPAVTMPTSAVGGAVVTLDTSTMSERFATLLLDGVGGGMSARGTDGREVAQGGYQGQVAAVLGRRALVVVVPPQGAGKAFSAIPTPVHPEAVVVDGAQIRVPARADGLDVFVEVDSSGAVEDPSGHLNDLSLTVHDAPAEPWLLVWGDPITVTPPRGCNGCDEGTHSVTRTGQSWGFGRGYGSVGGILVGTRNAASDGYFDVSMARGPYPGVPVA